jgi:predicted transcriptional regulator of viral defense system
MGKLSQFSDDCLSEGRAYFTHNQAAAALGIDAAALRAAAGRLSRQKRLLNVGRGFYLILRPEDRMAGAPDPVQWIDPFMRHLGLEYRVSLLRAAAHHGSSHQAAMVFHVIVPRQLAQLTVGAHRVSFVFQHPDHFAQVNQSSSLVLLKSQAGYAQMAGVELLLLDLVRYFHRAGGINNVAQVVSDLGGKARVAKLASLATQYETSCIRRLGYLLDRFGHARSASALLPFVGQAKSFALLDPSVQDLPGFDGSYGLDLKWKLDINEHVEIDF